MTKYRHPNPQKQNGRIQMRNIIIPMHAGIIDCAPSTPGVKQLLASGDLEPVNDDTVSAWLAHAMRKAPPRRREKIAQTKPRAQDELA